MIEDYALDLQNARRSTGLTQKECGHLLGISRSRLSDIENGDHQPHLKDIVALTMLYGMKFEDLFGSLYDEVRADMAMALTCIPSPKKVKNKEFRQATLANLKDRLHSLSLFACAE